MFGNQLAMLSLLLVGLSLSGLSNLSEAAHTYDELLEMLLQATDAEKIHSIFEELGGPFKVYADLADVGKEYCTPERILFNTKFAHLFGPGAELYILTLVEVQQEICEDTFIERLLDQYDKYLGNWGGKEEFQDFINFVDPWPTLETETIEMIEGIKKSIRSYLEWRMTQRSRPVQEKHASSSLFRSGRVVYKFLGSFLASFSTGRPFMPYLGFELQHALSLAKISDALRVLSLILESDG